MPEDLELLISPEEIRSIVRTLAARIREDYRGKTPVLVGILKGAFIFLADLAREMGCPLEVDFIRCSSYTCGTVPEEVSVSGALGPDVRGRDVIIVEGIVDRGATLEAARRFIEGLGARSVRVCTLLLREGKRTPPVEYAGRIIGEGFVVGYGMDYMGRYRGLPGIFLLKSEGP